MYMRTLCMVGAVLCLSACATVTVKPSSVTTSLISEDSALTMSAKAYQKQVETAGWVKKSSPLVFLQSKLFDTGNKADFKTDSYLDKVMAEDLSVDELAKKLVSDVDLAKSGLQTLNLEARNFLAGENSVKRRDVAAFEDALVAARQAKKSFEDCLGHLAETSPVHASAAKSSIAALKSEIDVSRTLADEITKAWQGTSSDLS